MGNECEKVGSVTKFVRKMTSLTELKKNGNIAKIFHYKVVCSSIKQYLC